MHTISLGMGNLKSITSFPYHFAECAMISGNWIKHVYFQIDNYATFKPPNLAVSLYPPCTVPIPNSWFYL